MVKAQAVCTVQSVIPTIIIYFMFLYRLLEKEFVFLFKQISALDLAVTTMPALIIIF